MFRFSNILTLVFQSAITFVTTVCIYMLFAILDSDLGIDGLFGLVFCLLIAVVLSVLTILICLIVGLPIRLNQSVFKWWTDKFYIPVILALIGLALLIFSLTPNFQDTVSTTIDGQNILRKVPNSTLQISGWFLTAFSTLHLFPPNKLKQKFKNIFGT